MTAWLQLSQVALFIMTLMVLWLASWADPGRAAPRMPLLLLTGAAIGAGLALLHG